MTDQSSSDGFQTAAFDRNRAAMVSRRKMPHWRQDGAVYFVTFRLADSLPQECLEELRMLRSTGFQPVSQNDSHRLEACATKYIERMDHWLHRGHGSCCLRLPQASQIVEDAFRYFDGQRYMLGPFVIMPNHVHVLVAPTNDSDLSKILHSWKSFTAKQINALLQQRGTLWQDESFDHIVRNDDALTRFTTYIEQNPAGLPMGHFRLGRGTFTVAQASSL